MPSPTATTPGPATLGLEALRKIAIEGFSNPVGVEQPMPGEGAYIRMPLEGRIDLMRRRREPQNASEHHGSSVKGSGESSSAGSQHFEGGQDQSTPRSSAPPLGGQPPTPGPDDVPPAPQHHPLVLPRSDSFDPAQYHEQHHPSQAPGNSHTSTPPSGPRRGIPPRSASPPMMSWNAAIEPPPNTTPTSNFPKDTYFPNVWDNSDNTSPSPGRNDEQPSPPSSSVLFAPPAPTHIPERLIREGHYTNVFGGKAEAAPMPDPAKVKSIFPWEEKPRQMPARVFPASDAPPPGLFVAPPSASPSPSSSSQTLPSPPQRQQHVLISPPVGLQTGIVFKNAWDTVPSIQKYASKLVRSPHNGTLAPAFDLAESRKKEDRLFNTLQDSDDPSMDGDDEDTSDESDLENEHRDESGRRRTKSTSSSHSRGARSKRKEYSSMSVQTTPKETRDQGVQVNLLPLPTDADRIGKDKDLRSPESKPRSSGSTTPNEHTARREWPRVRTSSNSSFGGSTAFSPSQLSAETLSPLGSPTVGLRSPRMFSSPRGTTLSLGGVPETSRQPSTIRPSAAARRFSSDTTSLSSPASTAPPGSPPDGHSIGPGFMTTPVKKPAGRVWDPARGVDVFKKGSEEVLARFLRGGNPT